MSEPGDDNPAKDVVNEEAIIRNKSSKVDQSLTQVGKKVTAAGALLKDKHPELFFMAPRPGGFIRNLTSPHVDPSRTEVKVKEDRQVVKPKGPQTTVVAGSTGSVSIKEILEATVRCSTGHKVSKDDDRNNMVRMCSIAISTVMMLAQHTYKDITLEHIKHTEEYFRGLKQEDGYPQNVGQLMQILATLKRGGQIVLPPPEQEDSEDEDEDIAIGDLIN